MVKNPPSKQEILVQSLSSEDPPEKESNDDKLAGSKWQDSVLTILENRSLRSVHLQARLLYIQASVPPGLFLLLMAPDNP